MRSLHPDPPQTDRRDKGLAMPTALDDDGNDVDPPVPEWTPSFPVKAAEFAARLAEMEAKRDTALVHTSDEESSEEEDPSDDAGVTAETVCVSASPPVCTTTACRLPYHTPPPQTGPPKRRAAKTAVNQRNKINARTNQVKVTAREANTLQHLLGIGLTLSGMFPSLHVVHGTPCRGPCRPRHGRAGPDPDRGPRRGLGAGRLPADAQQRFPTGDNWAGRSRESHGVCLPLCGVCHTALPCALDRQPLRMFDFMSPQGNPNIIAVTPFDLISLTTTATVEGKEQTVERAAVFLKVLVCSTPAPHCLPLQLLISARNA